LEPSLVLFSLHVIKYVFSFFFGVED
jgi:hypothetical protein